jgi:hypothetical protein
VEAVGLEPRTPTPRYCRSDRALLLIRRTILTHSRNRVRTP